MNSGIVWCGVRILIFLVLYYLVLYSIILFLLILYSYLHTGFNEIGSRIPRPSFLPIHIKLLDVLQNDPMQRFTTSFIDNLLMVTLIPPPIDTIDTTLKIQEEISIDEWRGKIFQYIIAAMSSTGGGVAAVGVPEIRANVPRPMSTYQLYRLLNS